MGVIYYKNKQYASGGGNSEETLYTAGTGIQISEDKIISTKDVKKNYIDNSNFRINRTGASEYSTPNEYTVDRWYIDGGTLKPVENGVQFINPNTESSSSTLVRLRQNIHYGFSEFAGKTLTISAKINNKIYSATATIPTEKPTEGTAAQFITAGIADFSINLNYSVTADYFVPYIAVAYNRTVLIEWMKLEVNGEFSGYIEPDYMTELIKMNFTTPDKGALDIPTGGESYDDTEIREDITTLEASLENKLDKDGNASELIYSVVTNDIQEDPTKEEYNNSIVNETDKYYGEKTTITVEATNGAQITCIREYDDKIFIGFQNGFGYYDKGFTTYTNIVDPNLTGHSVFGGQTIIDIIPYDTEYYVITSNRPKPYIIDSNGNVSNDFVPDNTGNSQPMYYAFGHEGRNFFINKINNKIYTANAWSYEEELDLAAEFLVLNTPRKILEKNNYCFILYNNNIIYYNRYEWIGFNQAFEIDIVNDLLGAEIQDGFIIDNYLYIVTGDGRIMYKEVDYQHPEVWAELGNPNFYDYATIGALPMNIGNIYFTRNTKVMYGIDYSGRLCQYDHYIEPSFRHYGSIFNYNYNIDPEKAHSHCVIIDDRKTEFKICIVYANSIMIFNLKYTFEDKLMADTLAIVENYEERIRDLEYQIEQMEEEMYNIDQRLANAGL